MTCAVDKCERVVVARRLCAAHYWHDRNARQTQSCTVDGCSDIERARGLCNRHYTAWWRVSRKNAPDKRQNLPRKEPDTVCSVKGCLDLAGSLNLCNGHYLRLRRHGDTQHERKKRRPCSECGTPAAAQGLCKRHYSAIVSRPERTSRNRALRAAYWEHIGRRCDLCGHDAAPNMDHDHAHCVSGCVQCFRGFLCSRCNWFEGHFRMALARGVITEYAGPIAAYLADPPFQRWLRERDDQKDAPLAA